VETPSSAKRILLVDDHPLVREAITTLIEGHPGLIVAGEASSATEAMRLLEGTKPDLILLDITLPGANGIEVIKDVCARHPGTRILVLSMHDEASYAERALRAGARGYIMKHQPGAVVMDAIQRVLSGELYVSPAMTSLLLTQMVSGHTGKDQRSGVERLSDRELGVFADIGNGFSSAEIAAKLHLSIKTVQTYRQHIKDKLGLRHSGDIVRCATEWVLNEATGNRAKDVPGLPSGSSPVD
jgi:DNA-binding NarL/FixJ family response regulator